MRLRRLLYATAALTLIGALLLAPNATTQTVDQTSFGTVLAAYLAQDCGSGEEDPRSTLTAVLRFGERAVDPLLQVVAEGPDVEIMEAIERDAREDFAANRKFLADGGLEGLQEGTVRELAEAMTESDYVRQRVYGIDVAYRQRALNALVELNYEGTAARLADIGENSEDQKLRRFIDEAAASLDK